MRAVNKYLFLILTIIIIVAFGEYQIKAFKNFYFFEIGKPHNTNGIIVNILKHDDTEGIRSYDYSLRYSINDVSYRLEEHLSPDSLYGVRVGDSIQIRYAVSNPEFATLKKMEAGI